MISDYNPRDDFNKSVNECYRVIRERMASGGPGWSPMSNSTFKLRSPEPGKVELSMSIDSKPVVLPVSHQALWNLVKDGIRMLDQWPLEQVNRK